MENKIVFVADLFAEDYAGGAELTSEALIKKSPYEVVKLRSQQVTQELIQKLQSCYWVFGNFFSIDPNLLPVIMQNINYSVLEYDYKFCSYRSIEKHREETGSDCDCHNKQIGQLISSFYLAADHVFWMSSGQKDRFTERFQNLGTKDTTILSSVFDDDFLTRVKNRREKDRQGWIVLGSNSWIKGADDAVKWCNDNGKNYQICWNLPYNDMLDRLETSVGFVYLPRGGDTCPRMVIEAKLLGCQVVTNDNVQHAGEDWWQNSPASICDYLEGRPSIFWSKITSFIQHQPTLSGYSTTYNCVSQNYPFVESITSLLDVCDEVCVVDSGSDDGTWEVLNDMAAAEPRLNLKQIKIDMNHPRHAILSDGAQKAAARDMCTGEFCWQQDVDEVIHERDYKKIRDLIKNVPKGVVLVCLPVVEFWGNKGKVRIDINPWKWRLSRNHPEITHGIPAHLREYDENGHLYAKPGTDSCDYITKSTGEYVPFVNFHTQQTEQMRLVAQQDSKAREKYVEWFNASIDHLPSIYHYSWFNLERKIKTYQNFWSKFWQSMYNIKQEDTAENNMFFDKRWSDVTEQEITDLAVNLEREMGGWIFHRKIQWNNPTPSVIISSITHPEVMSDWIESEE